MARKPDMLDNPRPDQFREGENLSGRKARHIEAAVVPVGLFVAGDTAVATAGRGRQSVKRIAGQEHD
jgi:hypothetical protein